MKKIKNILIISFPFVATLLLLRMTSPIFNPAGILAIIPIFYFGVIHPRDWFLPMAILGTLMLDFQMQLNLFWTILFAAAYAAGTLQPYIDLPSQKRGGIFIFMAWFGLCILLLGISSLAFLPIIQAIWTLFWVSLLYIPFHEFSKRIRA